MSSQRERQEKRERERSQRQLTTPSLQNNTNTSLFGEPIRKNNQTDDETTKRIKSTLGDYHSVQKLLINDPKPLLGISTREITRIKGHKAKIEQILSEMKNTLEPITALDDYTDDTTAKYSTHAFYPNNNSQYLVNNITLNNSNSNNGFNNNDIEMSPQIVDRNSRKNTDLDCDQTSGRPFDEQKSNSNHKSTNCKKRKSSKSDADSGVKSMSTKRTRSTSSSEDNSSDSSSNSSSISSSSSESSDDEEDEEGKSKMSDFAEHIKQEEIPNSRQETPKTAATGQQPERAVWDLDSFLDTKTTTTTTTSKTNSVTNFKGSFDNISDVIDQVAKGMIGQPNPSSSSSSSESVSTPSPKKRRKSSISEESVINEECKPSLQDSWIRDSPQKITKQNNTNQSNTSEVLSQKTIKEDKTNQQNKNSYNLPKSLIVSIKLMLLKRIPGQSYTDSNGYDSMDKSPNEDNNNNNIKNSKTKNVDKVKSEKKAIKDEPKESSKSKESKSKSSSSYGKSSSTKVQAPQIPPQDSDSRLSASEPILTPLDSRASTPAMSTSISSVKQETPISPQQMLSQPNSLMAPMLVSTTAANLMSASRTPSDIPSTGQPDDYLAAAKRLKHQADRENDRTVQACKYLEAVLYFILTGNAMEQRNGTNEPEKVFLMYKETLNLIRQITTKFSKSRSPHSADVPTTDYKLTTLSYRCQSLLYLKLSRIKSKEIRENNKMIQNQSPETSGSTTSVSLSTSLFTVIQRQLFLLQQYHTAHDLWQQGDHLMEKHPPCKAFITAVDNLCGPLSMNSSFDQLVHYVKRGLEILT